MQGLNFDVVFAGEVFPLSGTSCSSPSFASVIALINSDLALVGKPALGFLNPFLYQRASEAFTDITIGKNPGFTCSDNSVSVIPWTQPTSF